MDSTSSLEASPAKTSPLRVRERESKEAGLVFGLNTGVSLGKYDPDTQSLRTYQHSLIEDLTLSLVTLPRSGMMRNGRIYEQKTWVLRTGESESGSLPIPTVTAQDCKNDGGPSQFERNSLPLNTWVKKWPTPDSSPRGTRAMDLTEDTLTVRRRGSGQRRGMDLQTAAKKWPTPTARDHKSGRGKQPRQYSELTPVIERQAPTGQLNPTWVDWLMGYPVEWTDLKDSGMQLSLK